MARKRLGLGTRKERRQRQVERVVGDREGGRVEMEHDSSEKL